MTKTMPTKKGTTEPKLTLPTTINAAQSMISMMPITDKRPRVTEIKPLDIVKDAFIQVNGVSDSGL